jgi:hypothetical protein
MYGLSLSLHPVNSSRLHYPLAAIEAAMSVIQIILAFICWQRSITCWENSDKSGFVFLLAGIINLVWGVVGLL